METKEEDLLFLPPGFRFHPRDEEIITHYLLEKVRDQSFNAIAMGEVDLNKCEPWELPSNLLFTCKRGLKLEKFFSATRWSCKAKMGEKEWYFFCRKERRYPSSMRTNRATSSGHWKATGKDREIHKRKGSILVGTKKTLVFYKGRAPKGEKTNWVMHEFRLDGKFSLLQRNLPKELKDDWVVVRVFQKKEGIKANPSIVLMEDVMNQSVFKTHLLPPIPFFSTASSSKLEKFSNSIESTELSNNDWNTDIFSYDDLEKMWKY